MSKNPSILTASLLIIYVFGAGIYFKRNNYDGAIHHGRLFEKNDNLILKQFANFHIIDAVMIKNLTNLSIYPCTCVKF